MQATKSTRRARNGKFRKANALERGIAKIDAAYERANREVEEAVDWFAANLETIGVIGLVFAAHVWCIVATARIAFEH